MYAACHHCEQRGDIQALVLDGPFLDYSAANRCDLMVLPDEWSMVRPREAPLALLTLQQASRLVGFEAAYRSAAVLLVQNGCSVRRAEH